ncbi:unnamed protein product, partial [Effrenium voratum]
APVAPAPAPVAPGAPAPAARGTRALVGRLLAQQEQLLLRAALTAWSGAALLRRNAKESEEWRCALETSVGRTCVRYAVLANAGLACVRICQDRGARSWAFRAWRGLLEAQREGRLARYRWEAEAAKREAEEVARSPLLGQRVSVTPPRIVATNGCKHGAHGAFYAKCAAACALAAWCAALRSCERRKRSTSGVQTDKIPAAVCSVKTPTTRETAETQTEAVRFWMETFSQVASVQTDKVATGTASMQTEKIKELTAVPSETASVQTDHVDARLPSVPVASETASVKADRVDARLPPVAVALETASVQTDKVATGTASMQTETMELTAVPSETASVQTDRVDARLPPVTVAAETASVKADRVDARLPPVALPPAAVASETASVQTDQVEARASLVFSETASVQTDRFNESTACPSEEALPVRRPGDACARPAPCSPALAKVGNVEFAEVSAFASESIQTDKVYILTPVDTELQTMLKLADTTSVQAAKLAL